MERLYHQIKKLATVNQKWKTSAISKQYSIIFVSAVANEIFAIQNNLLSQ